MSLTIQKQYEGYNKVVGERVGFLERGKKEFEKTGKLSQMVLHEMRENITFLENYSANNDARMTAIYGISFHKQHENLLKKCKNILSKSVGTDVKQIRANCRLLEHATLAYKNNRKFSMVDMRMALMVLRHSLANNGARIKAFSGVDYNEICKDIIAKCRAIINDVEVRELEKNFDEVTAKIARTRFL